MSSTSAVDLIGVGIDTARYGHRVSFVRPDRSPAAPPLTVMEKREGYRALEDRLRKLHTQHPSAHFHVRIDAAGQYAVNLELFLRGLDLPMTLSVGEPKRNKDYQKAHFPKRTTDDTESQAMARFALVEQPKATPCPSPQMVLLRDIAGRLQAQVKQTTQAVNRLHNLLSRAFPELATLTNNIAGGGIRELLEKYPTAERIAGAHLTSLVKIPYLSRDNAEAIHQAARESVATLRGSIAETLVRGQVAQVRSSLKAEKDLKGLLSTAFADLPVSGHLQVVTIPGIGEATAAILVAKIVDIRRFETADRLVNYFGVFPEENRSGVDKQGRPLPAGTMHMCQKGNDLVRSYLWNAARVAIRFNPAIRARYCRLKSRGKRGDVAMGHCMRKLLHFVFAVWKTDRPFNGEHYPWANPNDAQPTADSRTPTADADVVPTEGENTTAVGHTRDLPAEQVVTTAAASIVEPASGPIKPTAPRDVAKRKVVASAPSIVEPVSSPGKPTALPIVAKRPGTDFPYLRTQVSISQVLQHLGLLGRLRGHGVQRRGPCPIHGQPADSSQTFSVHTGKNIFRCFHSTCGAQGNVLDLWAAIHKLSPYEAALHLASTFGLSLNRTQEPVPRTASPQERDVIDKIADEGNGAH